MAAQESQANTYQIFKALFQITKRFGLSRAGEKRKTAVQTAEIAKKQRMESPKPFVG